MPVNNRTVLHLLEALQLLQVKVPGGGPAEARRLSFRALDIEQIGHVYEGLLDHTAKRAAEPYLGLAGTRDREPEIPLAELEKRLAKGEADLVTFLKDETGKSENALKKSLKVELDAQGTARFRTACQGDEALWQRVEPLAGLVRLDSFGYPVVIPKGSVFVTAGTDRRSSGTHYTPRSLTEPIVQYTLEPLVYVGPAEGKPKGEWKLKSARELLELKICDMACGSGAFLVQAARYLAERLLEAWEVGFATEITENTEKEKKRFLDLNSCLLTSVPSVASVAMSSAEEFKTYAMRIIAQRCLYGVDKNPLAAEMAKLSLWLLTLAKDKPFEFLDHSIRCGDSLVGLHDIEQLRHYNLKPDADDAVLFKGPLDSAVDEAINLRLKLEDLPANTVEDVQRQEELLNEANDKMARLRCAADLLVAGEFWGENAKDKLERTRHNAVRSGYYVDKGPTEEFEQAAVKERRGQLMFHWPLEFPEVIVQRGGFNAFVGNPPFMGGQKLTGVFGVQYREHIISDVASQVRGSADLCAYFLLRAGSLLLGGGLFGFLATNTIAQGDTRDVGLTHLCDTSFTILRADASRPWPGMASLEVATVWCRKGEWLGDYLLDAKRQSAITSFLLPPDAATGTPERLLSNADGCFIGCYVLGMGFTLTPSDAKELLSRDPKSRDVLFPYLNGEDINSRPDITPSRWVINFADMPLDRASAPVGYDGPVAADYPECLEIVNKLVRPEREQLKDNADGKRRKMNWWKYGRYTGSLFDAIAGHENVLILCRVTKYLSPVIVPNGWVYSIETAVFSLDPYFGFPVLQSSLYEPWVRVYTSTLETRLRFSPSDCFETFPLPAHSDDMKRIGREYHEHRSRIMIERQEGLTKTYNRFHVPDESFADIQKLRDLHIEMDQAVAAAYGWTDLDLGHGFHETKQGVRFTISEPACREVLQRLLKLNHERYAEEVKQGLHNKKKGRGKKYGKAKDTESASLFD